MAMRLTMAEARNVVNAAGMDAGNRVSEVT